MANTGTKSGKFGKSIAAVLALAAETALAGPPVRTDGSIGPQRSFHGPTINIPASVGKRSGPNLLHSFDRFYPNGTQGTSSRPHTVTFVAPGSVRNVIARVTGGKSTSLSHTTLTIRESPGGPQTDANLFLMNPAGVLIGKNARFDVRGSIHVSTADALKFADGTDVPATPTALPVLTMTEPIGARFNSAAPKQISVVDGRIQLRSTNDRKQVVSLVGGGLKVQDGAVQVGNGRVNLVSVAGAGDVELSGLDPQQTPTLSTGMPRGDLALVHTDDSPGSETAVGALRLPLPRGGLPGGTGSAVSIAVVGRNLTMEGGDPRDPASDPAQLRVATGPGSQTLIAATTRDPSADRTVPGLRIDLSGDLTARGQAKIVSDSHINSLESQPMRISARDITFAMLPDDQPYEADGAFFLGGVMTNNLIREGNGSIGADLTIDCRDLTLLNGATIGGRPNAAVGGKIVINATGDVLFRNGVVRELTMRGFRTGLTTEVNQGGTNTSGAPIELNVGGDLSLLDGGSINSAVRLGGVGADGGDITVRVPNGTLRAESAVGLAGFLSGINTAVVADNNPPGDGGSITIDAKHLFIGNRAAISARTQASGRGGDITITASSVTLDGAGLEVDGQAEANLSSETNVFTGILSSSQRTFRPTGPAGDITITVDRKLSLASNAAIAAEATGEGPGGNITITARDVELSGGPELMINGRVLPQSGTRISALAESNFTSATAGTVSITTSRGLVLRDSRIATSAELSDGGNIDLQINRELGMVRSSITTAAGTELDPSVELDVNGGNISGTAKAIGLNDSEIRADALRQGGAIRLISEGTLQDNSVVSSKSGTDPGFDGTIELTTPDQELAGQLVRLVTPLLAPEAQLQNCCELVFARDLSSFTIKPREASPLDPAGWTPVQPRPR